MSGVLILSSSALTDRMLAHTSVLDRLAESCAVRVWAASAANPRYQGMWSAVKARVEPFPEIKEFPTFPHTYLRRLNTLTWDYYLRDPSRFSMMKHIRDRQRPWFQRPLKHLGRLLAALRLHEPLEAAVERLMLSYERAPQAAARLREDRPDLLISTGTFRPEEPAIVAAARKLGILVLGYITSWDNISIKNHMELQYDGWLVWSERMRQELEAYYPSARRKPISVVGSPQFDVFFEKTRYQTREDFCRRLNLQPELPIVLHALGVANGVEEHHAALDLARRVEAGQLGDAQLIVRPHPFNNNLEFRTMFRQFGPRIVVQMYGDPSQPRSARSQTDDEVDGWVNTFRHSDVVVHLSSTVAIDAALFDRPSVCLDYDPSPGAACQAIVREVNHLWTHYRPIIETGGTRLAGNPDRVVEAVAAYLRDPSLDRAQRRRMAEYVCGYLDGRGGERMAGAILSFLNDCAPGGRSCATAALAR
jgi:hypothetical protein